MIIPMARVRLLGPRSRLGQVVSAVQDLNLLHLTAPRTTTALYPVLADERQDRHARQLRRLARRLDQVGIPSTAREPGSAAATPEASAFARWARTAGRTERSLRELEAHRVEREDERVELARLLEFVFAFHGMLPGQQADRLRAYHLIIRAEEESALPRLRQALDEVLGEGFHLETARLKGGELAALLLAPSASVVRVEQLLARAGVHELPMPARYANRAMRELVPELDERLGVVDRELDELRRRREALLGEAAVELGPARAAVEDHLLELEATARVAGTARGFVLEGWIPAAGLPRLEAMLGARFGPEIVVETVAREEWKADDVPVVLSNPRLFRPFEAITRLLPLPRYGTIDPTPFVGVFFPMFFGLILGDMGYGLVLALLALLLRARSEAGTTRRAIAEIGGACAAFSVAFGMAFGEFLGDLGRRLFGLRPLLFDREESLLPFLGLALAIGLVHIVLGQVLGVINAARGHPRQALGRGVALLMVLLIVVALLGVVGVLPGRVLTPVGIALLISFPVLVIAEGIIAPIEFLSTLSSILSYARIMALGTASVMMAVVANQMAGSVGSLLIGVVFGLLFHLVNFALGVFAPTVHGLRLHYVEFFGKFYSPGGHEYRPFGHWHPPDGGNT